MCDMKYPPSNHHFRSAHQDPETANMQSVREDRSTERSIHSSQFSTRKRLNSITPPASKKPQDFSFSPKETQDDSFSSQKYEDFPSVGDDSITEFANRKRKHIPQDCWSMFRRIFALVAKQCCGISKSDGANTSDLHSRLASRGSRLIHPTSIFYVNEQFVLALLLFYTAINTPFTVAFYWAQGACDPMPTLPFDMFVDCYFLMDIVMTFFVGIWLEGKYVDEHGVVAWTYAKGSFCFDFLTSFPVSFLEKIVLDQCMAEVAGLESEQGLDTAAVRMLRVIKPLRLFKLFRILKVVQTLKIADALAEYFRIPLRIVRVLKVFVGIALGVHMCTCIFWLCKQLSQTEEQINEFVTEYRIAQDFEAVQSQSGGGADLYAAFFYFMSTIITTIGFGDIHPECNAERIYLIFVMYMGSIIFGILLAEVQQVVMASSKNARSKEEYVQSVMNFMGEHDIPRQVENEVMRWANFDFEQKQNVQARRDVLHTLPESLRRRVMGIIHNDLLEDIPILARLARVAGSELLLDLYVEMNSEAFYPKSTILQSGFHADRMLIVSSGTAKLEISQTNAAMFSKKKNHCASSLNDEEKNLSRNNSESSLNTPTSSSVDPEDSDDDDKETKELQEGDFFGDSCLLGETDWGANFPGFSVKLTAETFVVCNVLTKDKFDEITAKYPVMVHDEIKYLSSQHREAKKRQGSTVLLNAKMARVVMNWVKVTAKLVGRNKVMDKGGTMLLNSMSSSLQKIRESRAFTETVDERKIMGPSTGDPTTALTHESKESRAESAGGVMKEGDTARADTEREMSMKSKVAQAWFDTGGVKVEGAMAARCRAQQPSSGSSAASENDDFVSRSSQDDDADVGTQTHKRGNFLFQHLPPEKYANASKFDELSLKINELNAQIKALTTTVKVSLGASFQGSNRIEPPDFHDASSVPVSPRRQLSQPPALPLHMQNGGNNLEIERASRVNLAKENLGSGDGMLVSEHAEIFYLRSEGAA